MIDGVCGGIAQYFDLDPTLVRIAWVILTLLGGSGIILYIAAMIIMPKEPYPGSQYGQPPQPQAGPSSRKNSFFWGILLIVVGLFLFLDNIGLAFWKPWWWFNAEILLPVLLILAGVAFLWGGRNSLTAPSQGNETTPSEGTTPESGPTPQPEVRKLYRSFHERKLFGVCGGLAEYFDIDPTIVRILFVIAALASFGIVLLAYIIMAIILPKQAPTFRAS
jgi:phage shock protein C